MTIKNFKIFLFYFVSIMIGLMPLSVTATPAPNFFSDENFKALEKDPIALFSSVNACHLKSLLGKNDFDMFKQSMALETSEEDAPGYVSISGNVRGLFTIFEGFFRMSKSSKVWIAYLYNDKVHYFTNDEASLKQPPKIILEWAKRFQNAKWIYKPLTFKTNRCQ